MHIFQRVDGQGDHSFIHSFKTQSTTPLCAMSALWKQRCGSIQSQEKTFTRGQRDPWGVLPMTDGCTEEGPNPDSKVSGRCYFL